MTDMIEISNAMLERRIAQARHEGYDAAFRDMRSLSALDVSAVKDFPWGGCHARHFPKDPLTTWPRSAKVGGFR